MSLPGQNTLALGKLSLTAFLSHYLFSVGTVASVFRGQQNVNFPAKHFSGWQTSRLSLIWITEAVIWNSAPFFRRPGELSGNPKPLNDLSVWFSGCCGHKPSHHINKLPQNQKNKHQPPRSDFENWVNSTYIGLYFHRLWALLAKIPYCTCNKVLFSFFPISFFYFSSRQQTFQMLP